MRIEEEGTKFSWDEDTRQEVLRQRGVGILDAALVFEGVTLTKIDTGKDYGEERYISLGLVDDVPFIVVHTRRGDRVRLIRAWKGGAKEYEHYKNRIP